MWACRGAGAWLRGRVTRVPIGENARNQLSEAYTTGQKTNYDNSSQCVVWRRSERRRQAVGLGVECFSVLLQGVRYLVLPGVEGEAWWRAAPRHPPITHLHNTDFWDIRTRLMALENHKNIDRDSSANQRPGRGAVSEALKNVT
ncbi:hypothetical protein E2C01_047533 [Portunus trituberculatus]|uniref:Uncharacterized protein n=1 Tax=Portunus trituberculatus TaxID=210409 RepID=A0A5B7G874_PORTR|nr:hypothetical protein [Portunus trituberculatus]